MQQRRAESEGVLLDLLESVFDKVAGGEVILHVWRWKISGCLDESPDFGHVGGQGPGLEGKVATQVRNALRACQTKGLCALVGGGHLWMVLQVAAYSRHVTEDRNIQVA